MQKKWLKGFKPPVYVSAPLPRSVRLVSYRANLVVAFRLMRHIHPE